MRAAVNKIVRVVGVGLAVALQASLGASPAAAQDASRDGGSDDAGRFVPSFHIVSGVTVQEWEAGIQSEICRGCAFPSPSVAPLRPFEDGNDRDVAPYVGSGLELMTPELPLPFRPRFFVGGEFNAAFGVDRKVSQEGEPGIVGNPAPAGSPLQEFSDNNAVGQGSLLTAVMDHFTYSAHAGVALPFSWRGRQLRLKPSIAWMRWDVELEGTLADAECFQSPSGQTQCNPRSAATPNGYLRAITMTAEASETFNGVGPGLDLELDTVRVGPLGTSLFVGARFYRILGDRKVDFSAPMQTFSDPAGDDQTRANFSFEIDPWIYRVGVGIRFQWLGSAE